MKPLEPVAVIGLGLVGGSVARALSARGVSVIGFDANPLELAAAISDGIIVRALTPGLEDLDDADTVVIAVPVDVAPEILLRVERHALKARLVTDVGSTKTNIVAAAEDLSLSSRFVGSHPMVGDHRSGWSASRAELFLDSTVYLCPTKNTCSETLQLAESLWETLGAKTGTIQASDHDRLVAWSSHMPHMLSSALGLALARRGISRAELGRGGQDMTRIAGSSPELWTAIVRDNFTHIDAAIAEIERELARIRKAMRSPDRAELNRLLGVASTWAGETSGSKPDC